MTVRVNLKHVLAICGLGLVVLLFSAYDRADRFTYRIVQDEPGRLERKINSYAEDGWEPISMAAGGALAIEGDINSSTRHGAWVYVMMRRPK